MKGYVTVTVGKPDIQKMSKMIQVASEFYNDFKNIDQYKTMITGFIFKTEKKVIDDSLMLNMDNPSGVTVEWYREKYHVDYTQEYNAISKILSLARISLTVMLDDELAAAYYEFIKE